MSQPEPSTISFTPQQPHRMDVTLNGQPAGSIRKFQRFQCDAWTYDHAGISLVGPLPEVKATLRRNALAV